MPLFIWGYGRICRCGVGWWVGRKPRAAVKRVLGFEEIGGRIGGVEAVRVREGLGKGDGCTEVVGGF